MPNNKIKHPMMSTLVRREVGYYCQKHLWISGDVHKPELFTTAHININKKKNHRRYNFKIQWSPKIQKRPLDHTIFASHDAYISTHNQPWEYNNKHLL